MLLGRLNWRRVDFFGQPIVHFTLCIKSTASPYLIFTFDFDIPG